MKWSKQRAQINVAKFTQLSGATKILSSQLTVKSFFDLMFSKKILELICSQTNIYAQQRILLKPDPAWKPLLNSKPGLDVSLQWDLIKNPIYKCIGTQHGNCLLSQIDSLAITSLLSKNIYTWPITLLWLIANHLMLID